MTATNLATQETTNILLVLLTVVSVVQFVLLVGVLLAARSAVNQAKEQVRQLTGGDVDQLRHRFNRLVSDLEELLLHGKNILGTVERGTQSLGSAAMAVSTTAHRAASLSSFQAHALSTAVRVAVNWFLESPWRRKAQEPSPVQSSVPTARHL